jgi:hypothetical protein
MAEVPVGDAPYLPIRDGVVYAIRARTHAPINNAQIARSPPHRMSQVPRRTARGPGVMDCPASGGERDLLEHFERAPTASGPLLVASPAPARLELDAEASVDAPFDPERVEAA